MRYLKVFFVALLLSVQSVFCVNINQIENYLNNLNRIRAEFTQLSPSGERSQGTLFLERPGLLRMSSSANKFLIMADGTMLLFIDQKSGDISITPIEQSPASVLLEAKTNLNANYQILKFEEREDVIEIILRSKAYPDAGKISLIFRTGPLRLVSWSIKDAGGSETIVKLDRITFAEKIDPKVFDPSPFLNRK